MSFLTTPTDHQKNKGFSGYIGTKPDVDWWKTEIRRGVQYRKKSAFESKWEHWRKYYRNEFSRGVMPVNLFFRMIRTIVPRLYFRNPSISISAGRPGQEALAFAKILERLDNKLIRRMKMKREIKTIAQNAFMFGTGFGKLGYGSEFDYSPKEDGDVVPGIHKNLFKLEYHPNIMANMPWFMSAHPGAIVCPNRATSFHTSRWLSNWIRRPVDDVVHDSRLSNNKNLRSTAISEDTIGVRRHDKHVRNMIDLVEIRDKKTGRVMVIAPYQSDSPILYNEVDSLQFDNGIPIYPLIFNEDDEVAWGLPDSQILEPDQLEINEVRTQIMKHRRVSIVKILAKRNGITEDEAEKIVSDKVLPVVFTEDNPNNVIKLLQASNIPSDLLNNKQQIMEDVRESVGFGRNEFGEFNPQSSRTSAAEVKAVASAAGIRIDERRDMIADMLVDVISDMHKIIFNRWSEDQVIDVIGPEGSIVWVQFKGSMLRDQSYNINIDPDTSLPETRDLREQKAIRVFELLREDPSIDQIKLRRNLLRSLNGAQYEDMIREDLGAGLGQNPENPLTLKEFSNRFSNPLKVIDGGNA